MSRIVVPADAERVARGTGTFRVLAELSELEVIDLRFGPEFEGVDLHTHDDHVDSFYVLEGEAEFTLRRRGRASGAGHVRRGAGRPRAWIPQRR